MLNSSKLATWKYDRPLDVNIWEIKSNFSLSSKYERVKVQDKLCLINGHVVEIYDLEHKKQTKLQISSLQPQGKGSRVYYNFWTYEGTYSEIFV